MTAGALLALAASALAADAKADMVASQKAMNAQANYRYTITMTNPGKKVDKVEFEHIRPDRFHEKAARMELTIIGAKAWQRLTGGAWQISPVNAAAITAGMQGPIRKDLMDKVTLSVVGGDTLNGQAMTVYRELYEVAGIKSDSKIWVGVKDHLAYQSRGTTDTSALKGPGSGISQFDVTYEYNVPGLSIEAPM